MSILPSFVKHSISLIILPVGLLKTIILLIIFFQSNIAFSTSLDLECKDIGVLISQYNSMHLYEKNFDDKLSKRTLKSYLKLLDDTKLYFYKSDVDKFIKLYSTKLDDLIAEVDCSAIENIADLYSKRFHERMANIDSVLAMDHDFSIDEKINLDPDSYGYAKSKQELDKRWIKRVKFSILQLFMDDMTAEQISKKLKTRYDIVKKRHDEMTLDDVYTLFLDAFASSLDPHSSYFSPSDYEDFKISFNLSLEGIGVQITSEDGFTKITGIILGGATQKHGKLRTEDKIIAVSQDKKTFIDVIDMDLSDVVNLIRGKKGTTVHLKILRQEPTGPRKFQVSIVREKVKLEDSAVLTTVYRLYDIANAKTVSVGVVNVPKFYGNTDCRGRDQKQCVSLTKDVQRDLKLLLKQNIDALILDLRFNPGGLLEETIDLSGLFLPNTSILQTKDTKIRVKRSDDGKLIYDGPLVVLVNVASASASEIFAGAVKDHQRGLVVGDKSTFGKGTVQTPNTVNDMGAIKVTTSKYYTPSGHSTQVKGVLSHIVFPSLLQEEEYGEKYRDYYVAWEKIAPTKLLNLNRVPKSMVNKLTDLSENRRKNSKYFKNLNRIIQQYRKNKHSAKSFSLVNYSKENEVNIENVLDEYYKSLKNTLIGSRDPSNLAADGTLKETIFIALDYANLLSNKKTSIYQAIDYNHSELYVKFFKDEFSGCNKKILNTVYGC